MTVLHSSCSYFTFIYCHFHFLLSFGTRTLIRIQSFSFRKLRNEILRCTFRLKKVIWRVIKSIHICKWQKQYLNSLFPSKLSKEACIKMSFIETYPEHWPFRRHCLHFTSRSNLGRNHLVKVKMNCIFRTNLTKTKKKHVFCFSTWFEGIIQFINLRCLCFRYKRDTPASVAVKDWRNSHAVEFACA